MVETIIIDSYLKMKLKFTNDIIIIFLYEILQAAGG